MTARNNDLTAYRYSAVVLYFRRGREITDTINDLLMQSVPPEQVVLVDNASADGVVEKLERLYPDIAFVYCPENRGYAGGMNTGFRALENESNFVLFLTHEVRMDADCVERLLEAAVEKSASVAGPRLGFLGTERTWSFGGDVTWSGATRHIVADPTEDVRDVAWLDGSCLMVLRQAITSNGQFDARFFLYWEDVEFGVRQAAHGRVINVSNARAFQSTNTTPVYYAVRNRILFWRKRNAVKLLLSGSFVIGKWLIRDLPDRSAEGSARSAARIRGLRDGFSGKLSPNYGSVRERSVQDL